MKEQRCIVCGTDQNLLIGQSNKPVCWQHVALVRNEFAYGLRVTEMSDLPPFELRISYRVGPEERTEVFYYSQEAQRAQAIEEIQYLIRILRTREKNDRDYEAGIW